MRNWDIFSLEKRIFELEKGGGSTPTPTTWDYSTTETDTNQKWTDEKEIYCKVIVPAETTALSRNEWTLFTLSNASDIDKLIDVQLHYIDTVGTGYLGGNVNCLIQQVVNGFCYYNNLATGNIDFVIIKYTKKTASKKRSSKK